LPKKYISISIVKHNTRIENLSLERFIVGPLEVNSYLLLSETSAFLIDPGFPEAELIARAESLAHLDERTALLTHGHFDHKGACPRLQKMGWKVAVHEHDKSLVSQSLSIFSFLGYPSSSIEPDILFKGGEVIEIGDARFIVQPTPGHSPGSVSYIEENKRWAFTGDTLFADSIGRTDLVSGDTELIMRSVEILKSLLLPETLVMSGHGGRALFGTILKINPYLNP
jgi:glyoxylase-like metal-dependent hydrolase (beta-lactamase superfamily II)